MPSPSPESVASNLLGSIPNNETANNNSTKPKLENVASEICDELSIVCRDLKSMVACIKRSNSGNLPSYCFPFPIPS